MTTLEELDLSWNNLNGTIPAWVEGKSFSLRRLVLNRNQLSGEIPNNIRQLSELEFLFLNSNQLNGSIPDSIGQLSKLEEFDLSSNKLTGAFPLSIGQLSNLKTFGVSYNLLEGVVSEAHFASLSNLTHLDIGYNRLMNCEFKSEWRPPFHLEFISMGSCKLRTRFPKWTQSSSSQVLDLSNTSISGSFPRNIGHMMSNLRFLNLANNHLTGSIPKSLCNPPGLKELYISNNQLSGSIHDCWRNHSDLRTMDLSSNNLSGLIPSSIGQLRSLQLLRLNNNILDGEMPSTLANCNQLIVLDLGENDLSGNITWIGESPKYLWVLRLRKNKFSGTIPSSLSNLTMLSSLNLSYNNLSGPIPTGNQLQTLEDPSSIYIGNPLLCGPPLLTKCQRDHVQPPTTTPSQFEDSRGDGHEKTWLYLIVMSGFATGFWGVVGVLIFMKSWRYALFRMVDDVQDKIYVTVALKVKLFKKILNRNPDDQ